MFGWFKRKLKTAQTLSAVGVSDVPVSGSVAMAQVPDPPKAAVASVAPLPMPMPMPMPPERQELVQTSTSPTSGGVNTAVAIPKVGELAFHVLGDRRVRVKIVAVERNGGRVIAKQPTTHHVFVYSKRSDGGYRIVGATGKSGASLVFAQSKRTNGGARAPVGIDSPRPRSYASVRHRRSEIKVTPSIKRRVRAAAKASIRGMKAERFEARAAVALM